MWSSVVSALVLGAVAVAPIQLNPQEQAVWRKVRASVVTLVREDQPVGVAALIDSSGLFIAHKSSVEAKTVVGRDGDGREFALSWKAEDEATQLVLLGATSWRSEAVPVAVPRSLDAQAERLIAVAAEGPIRAQVAGKGILGMLANQRVTRLTAIEFEVPDSRFAGALLFSMRGELVGSIAATLRSESVSNQVQRTALGNAGPRGFGPAPIAVGYAVSPAVVERVVDGFRSPTHRVRHPKIGVFCKDHPQGGALVQSVEPGSPGALAGIKPGDIIAEIDGTAIRNQLDVAAVVFDTEVGQIIRVTYRRGQTQTIASIRVGT